MDQVPLVETKQPPSDALTIRAQVVQTILSGSQSTDISAAIAETLTEMKRLASEQGETDHVFAAGELRTVDKLFETPYLNNGGSKWVAFVAQLNQTGLAVFPYKRLVTVTPSRRRCCFCGTRPAVVKTVFDFRVMAMLGASGHMAKVLMHLAKEHQDAAVSRFVEMVRAEQLAYAREGIISSSSIDIDKHKDFKGWGTLDAALAREGMRRINRDAAGERTYELST